MPLTLDMSGDLTGCYDFQEPLTYTDTASNEGAFTIPSAVRSEVTMSERAPTGGAYLGLDCAWLVPNSVFTSKETPKAADTLTDGAGVVWTILQLRFDELDSVWNLTCVDLTLAHELDQSVDIYAPTETQDAGGARVPTFATVYTAQSARIQQDAGEVTAERGKRGTKTRYTVYLLNNVTVQVDYQIRNGATIYSVTGFSKGSRIDSLMEVYCEQVPG